MNYLPVGVKQGSCEWRRREPEGQGGGDLLLVDDCDLRRDQGHRPDAHRDCVAPETITLGRFVIRFIIALNL